MTVILCIDLEASCHEDSQMANGDLECIEIGIAAINERGEEIDRFQSYVKPENVPITEYSTSVNHITQDMVQRAPLFATMIVDYLRWVQTLPALPTSWYSWGKYDHDQLDLDCYRAGLPNPFPKHVDAKKVFQKRHLKNKPRVGLNKALELMELEFVGKKHSALDDAHNLARLYPYFVTEGQLNPVYKSRLQPCDDEHLYLPIPQALLNQAGWRIGDILTCNTTENGLLFTKQDNE